VVAGTAAAGVAAVLNDVVGPWPLPDVVPGAGPLLPGVLGGLVLLAWLSAVGGRVDERERERVSERGAGRAAGA
jgi:hypothetical protein